MPRKTEIIEEEFEMENDNDENVEITITPKEDATVLDLPGVGAATADKLNQAGYRDLMSIAVASPGELIDATGMNEASAKRIIISARAMLNMGFETASDVLKRREKIVKISSGSIALDNLMGGGFETGAITEAFGEFGSGKCVEKNTTVLYFNDCPHIESIEAAYNKYAKIYGETDYDGGKTVSIPPVEVLGITDKGVQKTKATFLFKEKVDKLYELKTARGRTLRVTGPHKLMTFDESVQWKPAGAFAKGSLLAYPKEISMTTGSDLSSDDAYFIGLFVSEGSSNPLSITTSSELLRDWLNNYVVTKFGYIPTIRKDERRETTVYSILLRDVTKTLLKDLSATNSATKFIPSEILAGTNEITNSFLAGYIDGDGHLGEFNCEATTKSETLCKELSYAFLKVGISTTTAQKKFDGNSYYKISVVGEDRSKLNNLPYKIKTANYTPLNSSYGYSKDIVLFLQKMYKETLGGNRGNFEKKFVKNDNETYYHYLTRKSYVNKSMNEVTFEKLRDFFYNGLIQIDSAIKIAESSTEISKDFSKLYAEIPFVFNSIADKINLSKSALKNYPKRGIPKEKVSEIKSVLIEELNIRKEKLIFTLQTMKNVSYLNWDEVTEIKTIDYDDYVYDFVVPDGHSFIGGDMPTIMHNTQIGHALSVSTIKSYDDSIVVYIDTENTFRPERIVQMCEGYGIEPSEALKRIKVARAYNSDHQMLLVEKVFDLVQKDNLNVKLVVIDSLTAHFRAEFVGRGTLAERQQKLNRHLHMLLKLADTNNLVVYVTNQVMSKPDMFFGDPTQAIGGHIVAHASTYRLYLRKGKKGSRVAKLIDSPNLSEGEAQFFVETSGLKDVK